MGLFSRRKSAGDAAGPGAAAEDLPPADILQLSDANFMAATEGGYTIVDFWAGWCAPCRQFAPTFETAARLHGQDFRFAKLDVEAARQAAAMVGVRSIPTVVVFGPDGSEVARASGALNPRQLEDLIGQARTHADSRT